MNKINAKFMLFALLTAVALILMGLLFYYLMGVGNSVNKQNNAVSASITEENAAEIENKDSEEEFENDSDTIHGEVIYDARIALPAQALLYLKLTEDAEDSQQIPTIIAEMRQQLSNHSPLEWRLPVGLKDLDPQKSYRLQAKISSGDTLLFVNAAPVPFEHNHAAYILRLAKVDGGMGEIANITSLIGQNWDCVSFNGKEPAEDSAISLYIDEEEKSDPTETKKQYRVSGNAGCNRFMGSVFIDENNKVLQFSPLAGTFMACIPEIMRQETDFLDMLSKVRNYSLNETGILLLLGDHLNPLARFTAR